MRTKRFSSMNYDELLQFEQSRSGKTSAARPRHIESRIQQQCKKWFDIRFAPYRRMLFAVPNGGLRGKVEAKIMKAEGITAGVADMILLVPRKGFGSLCIEFKTKTGRQSDSQKSWQSECERAGNKYIIIRDLDHFIREITAYLTD